MSAIHSIWLLASIFLIFSVTAEAATSAQIRTRCAPIEKQRENVELQLRAGYHGRAGEALRERARRLDSALYECRTHRGMVSSPAAASASGNPKAGASANAGSKTSPRHPARARPAS